MRGPWLLLLGIPGLACASAPADAAANAIATIISTGPAHVVVAMALLGMGAAVWASWRVYRTLGA